VPEFPRQIPYGMTNKLLFSLLFVIPQESALKIRPVERKINDLRTWAESF
jgi:hypothetical protein